MTSEISFEIDFRPLAWKRPAGKGARYDSQVDDKVAFSLKVLKSLHERFSVWPTPPLFPSGPLMVEALYAFRGMSATLIGGDFKPEQLKQDLDNLVKFTLDAMQSQYLDGVIWKDDRQVCKIVAEKIIHPDRDFIRVKVKRMES